MNEKKHSVTVISREITLITAVEEVISFDDTQVSLNIGQDTVLSINGNGLGLRRLSLENGEVDVSGTVDAIVYIDSNAKQRKRRFFG